MSTVTSQQRARLWLVVVVGIGALAGWLIPLTDGVAGSTHVLVGFVVGGLAYVALLFGTLWGRNPQETSDHFAGADPGRTATDMVVLGAAVASLVGVGLMLSSGSKPNAVTTTQAWVALGAVVASWLTIHTSYALRYARYYLLSDPGSIDFNDDTEPTFSDFAYFSFNLGMTYQVSDTNVKSAELRRMVLGHCLLSYVFGTAIVATTINLLVSLA